MIAKLIVWGRDRDERARRAWLQALAAVPRWSALATNVEFLRG